MLYDLWQQTVAAHRGEIAVAHVATGEAMTFGDLHDCARSMSRLPRGSPMFAEAGLPLEDFLVRVLACWRDGAVLAPCDGKPPSAERFHGLPAGIAHVKLTSGSTGEPKLVLFREEQLLADLENIRVSMSLDRAAPNLMVISPAHSYGFSNLVLPLLLMGMPVIVGKTPLPETLRRAFGQARERQTRLTLPAVPAMWRAWHQAGVLRGAPLALAISAGAPLPAELERQIFEDAGLKVHNFYGASECGGIAYDDADRPRADDRFIGRPMHRARLTTGEEGCLVVESPAVGECAWPRDDSLGAGRFVTSDIAELRDEGVFLIGRSSDTINVAGRKVSPAEIESLLHAHPEIAHCVVFGVPSADATRVEDIVACVNAGLSADRDELARRAGASLPSALRPRHWWFTTDLVPDARGKLSRARWKAAFTRHKGDPLSDIGFEGGAD